MRGSSIALPPLTFRNAPCNAFAPRRDGKSMRARAKTSGVLASANTPRAKCSANGNPASML